MGVVIRLATRGSRQAVTQAEGVQHALAQRGVESELVIVDTHGDRTQAANTPLHEIGGQGVFTKDVQQAVLDGRADAAVHSAKDLPTERPHQLDIAAIMTRRSRTDALIGHRLLDLEDGATVATGSVRRRAQIAEIRPDLNFSELRGNIETRLQKIPDGGSIVMAVSALEVLRLTSHIAEELDPAVFVPAVGQGAVAVECRND
jgi:hydroxymethylbilane synthase